MVIIYSRFLIRKPKQLNILVQNSLVLKRNLTVDLVIAVNSLNVSQDI